MENKSADYEAIEKIDAVLAGGEYRTAFRLFRRNAIGILCRQGILEIYNPYYRRNGKVKEDKVAAELVGAYIYYKSTNGGFRSFRPHGNSFRCGRSTSTFMQAVKGFLQLLDENNGQDPWEMLSGYMCSDYFDLEKYTDKAGVYGFAHNRRSREATKEVLAPYVEKYYGSMDAEEFIEFYQLLDRIYLTHGFPFACTCEGWYFEGYDKLYRKVLDEGVWVLHDFWEQGMPSDWLKKQMEPYGIQPSYDSLVEALQKPEYEPLLCRIFPFRLTEDTLRPGCRMDADEWEEFTLKLAKSLHFAEYHIGRKNMLEDMVQDAALAMGEALEIIRCYMNDGKTQ